MVNVGSHKSSSNSLPFGVPQGPVFGMLLFTLYTSSLDDIALRHSMGYHFYSDDTQIYISLIQCSGCQTALLAMENCIKDIQDWMLGIMLIGDKTDKDKWRLNIIDLNWLLVLHLNQHRQFRDINVTHVRNRGAVFDCNLKIKYKNRH